MNFEVQLDTYRAPDGTCVAPECSNVWDILQQSRAEAEVPNIPDYCQRWQQCKSRHFLKFVPEWSILYLYGLFSRLW